MRLRIASSAAALACGLALAATVASASAAVPAPVTSRFDAGADGWTVRDLAAPQTGGAAATAVPGRIATDDVYTWTVFSAPDAFLGDKRGYLGGTLAFELSDSLRDDDAERFPTLLLRSGATYLAWLGGVPQTSLTAFSATLAPSAQWLSGSSPFALAPAAAADFERVLGTLDAVYLNADWRTAGVDHAELDNVVLAAAVPEPATAALWAAGVAALVAATRRRTRASVRAPAGR